MGSPCHFLYRHVYCTRIAIDCVRVLQWMPNYYFRGFCSWFCSWSCFNTH